SKRLSSKDTRAKDENAVEVDFDASPNPPIVYLLPLNHHAEVVVNNNLDRFEGKEAALYQCNLQFARNPSFYFRQRTRAFCFSANVPSRWQLKQEVALDSMILMTPYNTKRIVPSVFSDLCRSDNLHECGFCIPFLLREYQDQDMIYETFMHVDQLEMGRKWDLKWQMANALLRLQVYEKKAVRTITTTITTLQFNRRKVRCNKCP
ncbi:hypothetical protein Tco_0345808, partial [Tanacetum coccineum]